MNLNKVIPKSEREGFLLSITKNCEALIEQTHTKAQETLEFNLIQSKETFNFKPPIQIKGHWMIGLISLEVYSSIFNITEKKEQIRTLYIYF